MEKLLMLGTTPTSVEFIELAKKQNVYTITTDYLPPEQSAAKLVSDEYWMISTGDLDALEKKCREEGVTGVLSGISEFNIPCMAQLCQRLGLSCWCTPESWNAIQYKHNFKKVCRDNHVPVATDYYLSNPPTEEELKSIRLPVVVKPVDMAANYGLSYCHTIEEVVEGCALARSMSDYEEVIVERMLTGMEYTAYYALAEGEASLLALVPEFSQPGYPGSCYSVMPSSTNRLQYYIDNVQPHIKNMLKAAGCREGICWIQLFLDQDGQFYAIEMGYRLSGDMFTVPLKAATGFDSMQWLLETALGKKHTAADLPESMTKVSEKCACSYILWSKEEGTVREIRGVEEIMAIPGTAVRYVAKEGKGYGQYRYMLVFTFSAENHKDMIEMIRKINQTVQILNGEGKNAVIYFDDYDAVCRIAEEGLKGL